MNREEREKSKRIYGSKGKGDEEKEKERAGATE